VKMPEKSREEVDITNAMACHGVDIDNKNKVVKRPYQVDG
jgi:hypothetical protein